MGLRLLNGMRCWRLKTGFVRYAERHLRESAWTIAMKQERFGVYFATLAT